MTSEIVQSTGFKSNHDYAHFNTSLWISGLINNIGNSDFFPWIAEQLKHVISHEFCVIFQYEKERRPQVLYDGLSPLGYREGLQNFLQSTWQINPFYYACREGLKPGLHTMEALSRKTSSSSYSEKNQASADYKMRPDQMEEIGYVTDGWPMGMQELMLAVPLPGDDVIEISLSQKIDHTDKNAPLLEQAQELVPVIVSAIKKHCEIFGLYQIPHHHPPLPALDSLTPREKSIMDLILSGHRSEAIGLHLGIALPTVKTHRKNLYHKLGISSQAELFAFVSQTANKKLTVFSHQKVQTHPLG
ncbi:helix-turn-helix transcriptional regulator [Kiloniella sp. EL199]|uniref:helix-turn-helix transcriptional regulator n=1 Tax=Kiloniella sp. EL199 TaxID=2107581 RepID=UPI000EA0BB6C|nr:helix-turn-helix transcriptional regulator [Kiloniella sp. EL199]